MTKKYRREWIFHLSTLWDNNFDCVRKIDNFCTWGPFLTFKNEGHFIDCNLDFISHCPWNSWQVYWCWKLRRVIYTVWKFGDLSATQILREINFWQVLSLRKCYFNNLQLEKLQNSTKIKIADLSFFKITKIEWHKILWFLHSAPCTTYSYNCRK